MKVVHIAVPVALTVAFALAYPYLQDRDWLESQRRELVARAGAYDLKKEVPGDSRFGPPRGAIPDECTAKAVAETVWSEIYGAKNVDLQKPLLAMEANGRWHVQGTIPRKMLGGVAYIILAKEDGRVIDVWHTK